MSERKPIEAVEPRSFAEVERAEDDADRLCAPWLWLWSLGAGRKAAGA
jgi:hypothetical protein